MFDNIKGLTSKVSKCVTSKVNQVNNLLDMAKNRIGTREGLQQWINKNVLSMPALPGSGGKVFTIVREFDTLEQPVSDTLWTIALLSLQQQGYTSVALLAAVTATSLNKSTGENYEQKDWGETSVWMLNRLSNMGMVESKLVEVEGTNRTQRLFYICPNWSKAHLNPLIEELRAHVNIVCKPLDYAPCNWIEDEPVQQRTKLQLVSRKADTLVEYRAGKETLAPLNKLQQVGFEVAENSTTDIFNCLDVEDDQMKRDSFTELLDLQGKRFFFPVSCDYRFRMYYRGGTVHPQAQKEVRQFLNFSEGETVNRRDAIADLEKALADRENPVQRRELDRLLGMSEEFVSCKVIINLDGIANGLQHQSVIMKSVKLAKLTKITKSDEEEVYQHVVNRVVAAGISVDRKFLKKIVMTASYGATRKTLLVALGEQLEHKDAVTAYDIMNRELPELKKYTQFITSRCDQFAHNDCQISTPDGFQLKFRKVDRSQSTLFAGAFSAITGKAFQEDAQATARATAPNLIHATDAYHLRLIVSEWKGNISTIHDSVGVTAGRGKELQRTILRTFKQVHRTDILNSWAEYNKVPALIHTGELAPEDINNPDMFA